MLTSLPLRLALSAFGFMLAGMATGNMILLQLGLIPLIFVIAALSINQPNIITVEEPEKSVSVNVDDELTLTRKIHVNKGFGIITLGEELPLSFELIRGNNFQAFWKGQAPKELTLRYRVKCTRRGTYRFEHLRWESRHPLGLKTTIAGSETIDQELIVKPKSLGVKRIRQQKIISKVPMPAESRIKIGVPTTDFKELREYTLGDSYKQINWKATARKQRRGRSIPTVNEYEKEGRRVVYILLDTSQRLGVGTTLKNSFEYAVQAVLGLSEFYIDRQCQVGLSFFNSESDELSPKIDQRPISDQLLFPETGKMQQYRIHRKLIEAEITYSQNSLVTTIHKVRGHIRGTNPLFIIVTNIHEGNLNEFMDGIKELSKYTRRSRRAKPNIMIMNVSGYRLAISKRGDKTAVKLLEYEENALLNRLRSMGLMTVNWSPLDQTVAEVLLAQVGKR